MLYNKEVLYHFWCPECNKWFTVGDHQGELPEQMTCPFCGVETEVNEDRKGEP